MLRPSCEFARVLVGEGNQWLHPELSVGEQCGELYDVGSVSAGIRNDSNVKG